MNSDDSTMCNYCLPGFSPNYNSTICLDCNAKFRGCSSCTADYELNWAAEKCTGCADGLTLNSRGQCVWADPLGKCADWTLDDRVTATCNLC